MEYVFGTTLVCDSLDNAKKVAFDKGVSTKTVTLGGDVFDPQGTLTGGQYGFITRQDKEPHKSIQTHYFFYVYQITALTICSGMLFHQFHQSDVIGSVLIKF